MVTLIFQEFAKLIVCTIMNTNNKQMYCRLNPENSLNIYGHDEDVHLHAIQNIPKNTAFTQYTYKTTHV